MEIGTFTLEMNHNVGLSDIDFCRYSGCKPRVSSKGNYEKVYKQLKKHKAVYCGSSNHTCFITGCRKNRSDGKITGIWEGHIWNPGYLPNDKKKHQWKNRRHRNLSSVFLK